DAIVVGGGLSGLATAFHLQRAGLAVEVLEAGSRAGGVIGSCAHDAFLYETGPNSALDTTPLIDALLRDLRILDQRVDASALSKRRYVVRRGRLVALPMSPQAFFGTRLFSARAKLALLREPFVRAAVADADESIAEFVLRRLGREFLDYAIDPFVAGVYAGDPDMISVRAAFPRLHALEQNYGSLIRGQIRGARERRRSGETAKNVAHSFSFREGMHALTRALVANIGSVTLGASVDRVAPASGGWRIEARIEQQRVVREARRVVMATPAYATAPLVASFAEATAQALAEIPYAPIAVAASAYRRADVGHPLDGFGMLIPRVERRRILGALFSSSMFPGRAPDNAVLLTAFVGGMRQPELAQRSDEEVTAIVRDELASLLQAKAPLWTTIVRWPRAIPQYTRGHLERIALVDAASREFRGLHFCANYRGGVAVGDCIRSAHELARSITSGDPRVDPLTMGDAA
ncbi:MAG TPA: protoporphyrinogen oxidase, partial [Casimicrobiaceae bacterium]|nr:protoporphyrinogen oxidase [Casimicrobiaceae bacterium]